jgi:RecA-family ATPase
MSRNGDTSYGRFAVVTLADVVPERVSWLWKSRLPLGKLVTVDGDPGVGKSTLALTWAALITTGGMWPDRTCCDYPGDVILLSAEDGLADTIRPRLDAAGADTTRIHAVQGVPLSDREPDVLRLPTLGDTAQLRELINATAARLVIIDVLMAYMPVGVDSHRDQDMRQVLARLAALADGTNCTILLLRHLNKGRGDALYRGGGSIGIVGAARVGMVVATDPDDVDLRVLAPLKNNLSAAPPSLSYRLVPDELYNVARVQWVGESTYSATELLSERDTNGSMTANEVKGWLEDYLRQEGPCWSRDVKDAGRKEGHSQRGIERAAQELRIKIREKGFPRQTFWEMPQ